MCGLCFNWFFFWLGINQEYVVLAHNLSSYVFMQKNRFLQNQHAGIEYASFLGEVYEAYFYESLLKVVQTEGLDLRLAAKGPYAPVKKHYVKTGFFCTGDGKCVYNMQGAAFAEFDCLAIGTEVVYFYECSISNKCNAALKKEMLKKKVLLEYLFPQHQIIPVVVSAHEAVVAYCERWKADGIEAWQVVIPDMDCVALAHGNQPKSLPKPKQIMSLQELNYLIAPTPYFEQLAELTAALAHTNGLQDAYACCQNIQPEWFSRLYWGMVSGSSIGLEAAKSWEAVMVVVDLTKNAHPTLRYYAYQEAQHRFFEFTPELEPLKRIKFSRLELAKILPIIRFKSDADFQELQQELRQFRYKVNKCESLSQVG